MPVSQRGNDSYNVFRIRVCRGQPFNPVGARRRAGPDKSMDLGKCGGVKVYVIGRPIPHAVHDAVDRRSEF